MDKRSVQKTNYGVSDFKAETNDEGVCPQACSQTAEFEAVISNDRHLCDLSVGACGESVGLSQYLFHQGTNFFSYDYLGANKLADDGRYIFRVWAPNAEAVYLVGDFNFWDESMPMVRISERGVWE